MRRSPSRCVLPVLVLLSAQLWGQDIERVVYDYTQLYRRLSPSIPKIESDSGFGSGFLVSTDGLIATNHHVVRNTRFLAVQFADGRRVRAAIVKLSPRWDIAVLKIHPSFVEGFEPLTLASAEAEASTTAGMPVVAFGSPLGQNFLVTQGIISKVQEQTLLGDFLLEPGNSGGPLVDLDGTVLGINTFGVGGIAGAIRVSLLKDILHDLDPSFVERIEVSDQPLRRTGAERFPTEVLKAKIIEDVKVSFEDYQFDAKNFTITAQTPVWIGRLQTRDQLLQAENRYKRRGRKIADPDYQAMDEPFYEWHRSSRADLDLALKLRVEPKYGQTGGSIFRGIASAALGYRGLHYQTFEFKGEFLDLKVFRDGKLLEPITPGRIITENTIEGALASFVDEAYSGMYTYDPADFMTGQVFRFEVYDAKEPGKPHEVKTLKEDSKLIRRIRADFEGTWLEHSPTLSLLNSYQRGDLDFPVSVVSQDSVVRLSLEIPKERIPMREIRGRLYQTATVACGLFDEEGNIVGSWMLERSLIIAKDQTDPSLFQFQSDIPFHKDSKVAYVKVLVLVGGGEEVGVNFMSMGTSN